MKVFKNLNWQAYLAEFIGTFIFVFIASGVVLTNLVSADIGVLGVAIATGLALSAMIYSTVGISGGHLNPAVTLALWFGEKISFLNAVIYISMQILAGIAASYLLLLVFGLKANQFALGGPVLDVSINVQTAILIEAILTGTLVFAVFATMVDKRGPVSFGPLVVGLVVLVGGIFAGSLTGASLNPARAIGPLIVSQSYSTMLVWIIAPLAASLVGFAYKLLFLKPSPKRH